MMQEVSPLRKHHEAHAASLRDTAASRFHPALPDPEAEFIPYGPAADTGGTCEILATYGFVEAEYAAMRRGAGIIDDAQRGVIRVSGGDRIAFLDRMLTQELKDLSPGRARQGFWLNRKGRIDADLLIMARDSDVLLVLDRADVAATVEGLSKYALAEDVEFHDWRDTVACLGVHGPRAMDVLALAGSPVSAPSLEIGQSVERTIAGTSVTLARFDAVGDIGIVVLVDRGMSGAAWETLIATDGPLGEGRRRVRPVGWYAWNMARIEGGTPLFHVDFGPTNLPHETGVLRSRVSFTKGCYLGQEIVARLEHLGRPKQELVGLLVDEDLLPAAGATVFAQGDDGAQGAAVGVVTSSTLSPMRSASTIAFAMVRASHVTPGTRVIVHGEGGQARASVAALESWRAGAPAS